MRRDSVAAALAAIKSRLSNAGIVSARLDARLIVQHATQLSHEQLITDARRPLTESESRLIERLARRRAAREPVSRLFGEREFYGRAFGINQDTLDPRADTETLVETALRITRLQNSDGTRWRIADLGTGSGAVIITLLAELPEARGVAGDLSRGALAMARENALRHKVANRLELVHGSWFQAFTGSFDLIVSNPPYIAEGDLTTLAPEVRLYDPAQALNGGPDGLKAYRQIADDVRQYLRIGGHLCLEIGRGQEEKIRGIMLGCGLRLPCKVQALTPDPSGITRVLTFKND